jgi:mutual gliding-motility protein MglA
VQLNFAARELAIKLVYYGPALSGKTTNLRSLHDQIGGGCGRLMTLETKDDRTLFFDVLPVSFRLGGESGLNLRLKVYTVPGQVVHASTRRLVLQAADGVVFVADSQLSEVENNAAAFLDLRANLKQMGRSVRDMPLVIQFNKRDVPGARSDEDVQDLARKGAEPVYTAVAVRGEGVIPSFFGLLDVTFRRLEIEHKLSERFGMTPRDFLERTATHLGWGGKVDELLAKCRVSAAPTSVGVGVRRSP